MSLRWNLAFRFPRKRESTVASGSHPKHCGAFTDPCFENFVFILFYFILFYFIMGVGGNTGVYSQENKGTSVIDGHGKS